MVARPAVTLSAVVLAAALAACSSETSIVLMIHADPGVTGDADRLEVYVGAGRLAAEPGWVAPDPDQRWWIRAPFTTEPAEIDFDAVIGERGYELLVRPSDGLSLDDELVFALVARGPGLTSDPGSIKAFAASADYVQFAEGQVRRIDAPLAPFNPERSGVTDDGCVWWTGEGGERAGRDRAIVPAGDQDCDGFVAELDDCNDHDPRAYTGAAEVCDGADNDCDGAFDTTERICGEVDNGACRLGTLVCDEANGSPSMECETSGGNELPEALCELCNRPDAPRLCDQPTLETCKIVRQGDMAELPCDQPAQEVPLLPCPQASCTWHLEGGTNLGGWIVTLSEPSSVVPVPVPTAERTGSVAALRVLRVGAERRFFPVRRAGLGGGELHVIWLDPVGGECRATECRSGPP